MTARDYAEHSQKKIAMEFLTSTKKPEMAVCYSKDASDEQAHSTSEPYYLTVIELCSVQRK
jgi:hypothetical protein